MFCNLHFDSTIVTNGKICTTMSVGKNKVTLSTNNISRRYAFSHEALPITVNGTFVQVALFYLFHRVQRSIRGDCYVKRGVSFSKWLICEHGKFICICSNKGTESDQNY